MNFNDLIKSREQLVIARKEISEGVVTVPEEIVLPIEFRIRRWKDEESYKNLESPYLETRDGDVLFSLATITNGGGQLLWKAIRGDSITGRLFNNAGAKLVVSNVTGTPAYTDTTVVNELGRKAMDTSFPLIPGETAGTATAGVREMVFRSTFGSSDSNGDWRRFWIVNSNGTEDVLDNFSSSQGTKASGQVWELTVTLRFT